MAQVTNADERLRTYRRKRDFARTPEPSGDAGAADAPGGPPRGQRFVVQRHRARRLHYDLRLEMGGVLVSWAVPKGPTLDPSPRRMAVRTEDHPLDYFDFEGVIPSGEYGGGDVIVWDWGTWEHGRRGDAEAALRAGELHVDLHGEKLVGRFVLVRTGGPESDQWLLLHKQDEVAVAGWDAEDHPRSVKTGRTNDEVAARPDDIWHRLRSVEHLPSPTSEELEALDVLGSNGRWLLQGRELRLTNLDKVLFPAAKGPLGDARPAVTKRDHVRYLAEVGPWMVPYLMGRPVNTRRHPDGAGTQGFWQKSLPPHAPAWVARWRNDEADPGETEIYAVVDEVPTLVWLGNHGALELHGWTSTTAAPHGPTWAMIDIDPGRATSWDEVLVLARLYRTALEHLGVLGCPKVTGQRGVQIWVPVRDGTTFERTRHWVETVSRAIGATVPELVSWEWRKDERAGLARLDYTQNAINRTLVTPFSTRAAPGAPVSMTITWDELDDPDLRPDGWSVHTALDRLRDRGDPLAGLLGLQQDLPDL